MFLAEKPIGCVFSSKRVLKRKGNKIDLSRRAQLKVFAEDEKQDCTCIP